MTKNLRKAEKLYETFHQFEPVDVGNFRKGFLIPSEAFYVGHAKAMYYTSDKLNPLTGEDEGEISYFHDHKPGVRIYLPDGDRNCRSIPKWIYDTDVLVRLGTCDGFDYQDFNGETVEAEAVGRKPEWYTIPSGKALLAIQDKRKVLAIAWGGKLNVEWRGVVG